MWSQGVQALRGFAALLVVLQHSIYYVCLAKGVSYRDFQPANFGEIGVWLFFVISGYVMTFSLGQGKSFLPRRILRIYPPFIVAVLISSIVAMAYGASWRLTWGSLTLTSFFQGNGSYMIPYWTLIYEVAFYALIALLIVLRLRFEIMTIVMATWVAAILISNTLHLVSGTSIDLAFNGFNIYLSQANFFFIAGWFLAVLQRREIFSGKWQFHLLLGITMFMLSYFNSFIPQPLRFLLLATGLLFVVGGVSRLKFNKTFNSLGNASYGIYLVHDIVIISVTTALGGVFHALPTSVGFMGLFSFATMIGFIYGWAEYRAHRYISKRLFSKRNASIDT